MNCCATLLNGSGGSLGLVSAALPRDPPLFSRTNPATTAATAHSAPATSTQRFFDVDKDYPQPTELPDSVSQNATPRSRNANGPFGQPAPSTAQPQLPKPAR